MTTEELLPENEVKLLVLKSHLLSLFTSCRSCHYLYTCCEVAHQVETFTSIRQNCSHHRGHVYFCIEQQGIYTSKKFALLKCLQVTCITDRPFYVSSLNIVPQAICFISM